MAAQPGLCRTRIPEDRFSQNEAHISLTTLPAELNILGDFTPFPVYVEIFYCLKKGEISETCNGNKNCVDFDFPHLLHVRVYVMKRQ